MKEIVFSITILTDNENLEEYFFEKANDNSFDLGKGISVFKESCNDDQLIMKIEINKDKIKSYDDSIRKILLSNIIASWLVYKMTGKKISLLINEHPVPFKKNSLKNYVETLI